MEKLSHAAPPAAAMVPPTVINYQVAYQALATRIRRAVRRNTSGGVQGLAVEVDQQCIRLLGHCATFYCKQLAQQAALRMNPDALIINEIEVAQRPR